jgi:DNA-binding NarL/FixJ family response regulator
MAALARTRPPAPPDHLDALTGREHDILALVGTGMNNKEIAAELHLSPATTRTYVSRLLSKLNARDRAQLVVTAYRNGLVQPGQP